MATDKVIGSIPEFTTEDTAGEMPVIESVEEAPEAAEAPEEVTLSQPSETQVPASDGENTPDLSENERGELQGLRDERIGLLKEIQELRGTKRELKQQELQAVETRIDELSDLNPADISVVERILRSKGYMTKEEQQKLAYEATKDEELTKFLDKYPEYKPENDRTDENWSALQREISLYRLPENARMIGDILERAHRSVSTSRPSGAPSAPRQAAQVRRVEVARAGQGGTQRASTSPTLSPDMRQRYRDGGWSEDEINEIESKLPT